MAAWGAVSSTRTCIKVKATTKCVRRSSGGQVQPCAAMSQLIFKCPRFSLVLWKEQNLGNKLLFLQLDLEISCCSFVRSPNIFFLHSKGLRTRRNILFQNQKNIFSKKQQLFFLFRRKQNEMFFFSLTRNNKYFLLFSVKQKMFLVKQI